MSKKEMGLAVKALAQYADDCLGNGDYLEMDEAFKIALNIANMHELKEMDWIADLYATYLDEATENLEEEIAKGNAAKRTLDILQTP